MRRLFSNRLKKGTILRCAGRDKTDDDFFKCTAENEARFEPEAPDPTRSSLNVTVDSGTATASALGSRSLSEGSVLVLENTYPASAPAQYGDPTIFRASSPAETPIQSSFIVGEGEDRGVYLVRVNVTNLRSLVGMENNALFVSVMYR